MRPETDRVWCYQHEAIFHFDEMVESLRSGERVQSQTAEAIIIAWVNLLQNEVVKLSDQDESFSASVREGDGTIYLRKSLAPKHWDRIAFGEQIARRTGLSFSTVCSAFLHMSQILFDLNCRKAFEPVGWFEVMPKSAGSAFKVYLWKDFPQPVQQFEVATLSGQLT